MSPSIRVMSSRFGHRYDEALYAPISERVTRVVFPASFPDDDSELRAALANVDVFHLHWPELVAGPRIAEHLRLIELLEEAGVPIVWTQHNLLPHKPHRAWSPIYQCWADVAEGVIHHSHWGMARALEYRCYRAGATHRVIRHGHWGAIRQPDLPYHRDALAAKYKLDPARTHLGILGAPRPSKDIGLVVDGFLGSGRDDLDLSIFSLGGNERVFKHPRIRSRPYKTVSRAVYNFRLAMIDILLLPFRNDGSMLTTGLIGDAIGVAKPAIVSDWPFLTETFGDAAITYGNDAAGLSRVLADLDTSTLDDRSDAMRALQATHSWEQSAAGTVVLLEDVLNAI